MNWEAIAAISQIIGTIAVVVSLLYLAVQIKSQARESRIDSVHELNEAFRSAITAFQNAELASLFVRGKENFETLEESERLQFISMVQGIMRVWEDAYRQHKEKRLDKVVWKAMVIQFSGYMSLPGVMSVWTIRKNAYSEDFRAFVDSTPPIEYKTR